jgi:hypothetical protein
MRTKLAKFIHRSNSADPAIPAIAAIPASGSGMDLHGWTLEQIRDHCLPDEWDAIKNEPKVIECIARNLRRYPYLRYVNGGTVANTEAP